MLKEKKKAGTRAYLIGWGPNEYTPLGTLKDFEYTNRLNEIQVPALIISGTNDLCTPLVAKTMYDGIKCKMAFNARMSSYVFCG